MGVLPQCLHKRATTFSPASSNKSFLPVQIGVKNEYYTMLFRQQLLRPLNENFFTFTISSRKLQLLFILPNADTSQQQAKLSAV